jgi:amino acid adenylation domain-containing protein
MRGSITEGELREFAIERLAEFKVPSQIVFVAEIPKGPTGKVQRIGLHEKLASELTGDFLAPVTALEEQLAQIWSEVLVVDPVGMNDNFFQLGGDSLRAGQLLSRIRTTLEVELSFRDLLLAPTPAGVVNRIGRLRTGQAQSRASTMQMPSVTEDPERKSEPFPLTDIQQSYWVGRNPAFELGNVSIHSYTEVECIDLDLDRFARIWLRLVERHDMLRCIVLPDGLQQILPEVPNYQIETFDLRGDAVDNLDARLDEIRERMSHQVRRADVWPLFEICVSRLDERLSRVHFSFDGMVLDAWSRFLLFKELTQLYRNPETNLVPLELSFRDYVLAESKFRNSDLYLRSEKYWHNHLRSLTPAPKLPLAADASSIEDPRFVRRSGKLPAEIWTQLKSRVHKKGLTTVGMLVAAFAEVVAVWSNSRKFTLNVPYYNRLPLHRQVGEILGDFSSLTLLAVDNTGESSFEDRARRLQEQLWKDLDHSYYSGIRVLRELAKVLGRNTGALMPVVFTSAPQDPGRDDISPTTVLEDLGEVVCSVSQTPQVWLDVQVYEEADGLVFHWNAVEALFPSGLMEDMFDAYCRLLNRFAGEERTWLETSAEMALRMIPPTLIEQRELINATEAPMPDELLQTLFARQARERPNQPAVITSNRTMTYEELSHQAKQVGRRLREMGARPNVLVAVVMEKGWEPVVAVLGILMSGSACLPIDPKVPEERLCYLLENGEVELVLTQPCLRDTLTWPRSVQCFCVDDETFEDAGIEPLDPVQNSDDLAFVIYTSGSTGLPKGVMIEHRSIANAVCAANARFRVGPEDRVLALTPLHHDLSLYDIFGMLAAGGGIVMPEESGRRDPAHWATLMTAERVTVWNSVPTMMKMLIEYVDGRENRWPDELRLAFLGGDWIPVALPKQLKVLAESCQVVSIGGPTETTIWNIWYPIHTVDPSLKSIPYGRPIANSKYYVLSDLLEHCPISVPGHLYCAGIGLAKGYWRDSDKTQANFITHPRTGERLYRTGDLGCYLQDGNIEFLGREDSQVQIYGNRVELGEIEAALMLHSGVRSAVVAAVGKLHEEKRLVGYVVLEHGFTSPLEELRRFLRQKLPVHMIPGSFVKLEELPLTSNGKLDRKSLPDPAEKLVDSSQPDRAGQPDETRRITSLVEEILKVDSLEPDANWLNLGATSVDMIRIANLLDKELGFRPKIDQLYREPTAIALAHAYQLKFQKPADGVEWTMPTVPTSFVTTKLLVDPEEREAFKKRQRGLRSGGADETSIHLATSRSGDALRKQFTERRSYRQFENQPLPFQQFSEFFGCLRQIRLSGVPKYLYPSGGGLYCVQSYLYIKQGRVEGLAAGAYYYHPVDHRLVQISADAKLDAMIYSRLVNRPIYDEAGFAIFLIAELAAIVPMYGDRSINLATLEAGYMGQLLMMSAPAYEIGLCPIGSLDFDRIRDLFALEESHVLVHSMLGGRVDHGRALRFESFQECYDSEEAASENREEGEI